MDITIRGRSYEVSTREPSEARKRAGQTGPVYDLKGKRGGHYYTVRNVPRPEMMFLCNARGHSSAVVDGVWLTDKDGDLKVVSS